MHKERRTRWGLGEKRWVERPTGIEPVASAWEAEVLPLYEGRVSNGTRSGTDYKLARMHVVSDEIIPARAGWSREIRRGQVLRLVDLEGKQAVDFL